MIKAMTTASLCSGLVLGVTLQGWAAERATPAEVVAKVREAAQVLSRSGESTLEAFDTKDGAWVWKDTYVFVFNCGDETMLAHPFFPSGAVQNLKDLQDQRGERYFLDLCHVAGKPDGGWVEYWWPEPWQAQASRKVTYTINVPDRPYQVAAGIYDPDVSIVELEEFSIR